MPSNSPDSGGMISPIQHTVTFRLNDAVDSDWFLGECQKLASIPGVTEFEILVQVGQKADFTHGLSMVFSDAIAYAAYDSHPDHQAFVHDVWLPNVAQFLELDYQRHSEGS
jgi:hypothetical protein